MTEAQVISFNEIIPEATVRVAVIDGIQYISITDIIMVMCGQISRHAAQTWSRIPESLKNEVGTLQYKFKGRGQKDQPLIQLNGALKLIMLLPGETAKSFRTKAADILTKYFSGDLSLTAEIEHNKMIGAQAACQLFVTSTLAHAKRKRATSMPSASWIYGTQSDAFPGLIKIGRSINVKARISSGNTFCAPTPHFVIAAAPTFDAVRDELAAHEHFADFRAAGEFFSISTDSLKSYFSEVTTPLYKSELQALMEDL
jgi:hypothetical protein